jgi:hypothetical protein
VGAAVKRARGCSHRLTNRPVLDDELQLGLFVLEFVKSGESTEGITVIAGVMAYASSIVKMATVRPSQWPELATP